jgi:transcriptional repressor NrdR
VKCPSCQNDNDKVIDSRTVDKDNSIRRRRECLDCSTRYTTYEHYATITQIQIVKRDGTIQLFNEDKLHAGVNNAASSTMSEEEIDNMVEKLTAYVRELNSQKKQDPSKGRLVTSFEIGSKVLELLKSKDEVAYLRFASVYKDFTVADDFTREAKLLRKK